MPVPDSPPLVTPLLLTALQEDGAYLPEVPASLQHLENTLEWGDLLGGLYDLVLRPDVKEAEYAADDTGGSAVRDVGVMEARQFAYLRTNYGRIAPVGYFWRMFDADVRNGGHDQYCFNHLAGAEPKDCVLALLIRTIEGLALDQLPSGDLMVAHFRKVLDRCHRMRDSLVAGYEDGGRDDDWDALDDEYFDTLAHSGDDCPGGIWDRHVNARLREIVQKEDRRNLLAPLYESWAALPPPTQKQTYEIESERASKKFVEDYLEKRKNSGLD